MKAPKSPFVDSPIASMPFWLRTLYTTVVERGTPLLVCTAAAGRHQRGQQYSNPATTYAWVTYLCTALKRQEQDLRKVLLDSGIPMQTVLPDTGRKRGEKDKKATDGCPQKIPMAKKHQDNLTPDKV